MTKKEQRMDLISTLAIAVTTFLFIAFVLWQTNRPEKPWCVYVANGQDANTGQWYEMKKEFDCDKARLPNKIK